MSLGNNIRAVRKEKKLSQVELGKAVGVSRSTIANWEKGKTSPATTYILKLANFFNITTDYLLGYTPTPQFTRKDERDVQKIVKNLLDDPNINKNDEEEVRLLQASFEKVARISKLLAKKKFTPKKYRKNKKG